MAAGIAGVLLLSMASFSEVAKGIRAKLGDQIDSLDQATTSQLAATSEKARKAWRRGAVKPTLTVNGVPVAPHIEPMAPEGAAPEPTEGRRWLPGYRPASQEAIVAFERWEREQRGFGADYVSGATAAPSDSAMIGRAEIARFEAGEIAAPGSSERCPEIDSPEIRASLAYGAMAPVGAPRFNPPGSVSTGLSTTGLFVNDPVPPSSEVVVSQLPPASPSDHEWKLPPRKDDGGWKAAQKARAATLPIPEGAQFAEDAVEDPKNPGMALNAPPSAGVSFASTDYTQSGGSIPPDSILAVGPNHIVTTVNVRYAIYNKTGTQLVAPTGFLTLFSATNNCKSPQFLYDPFVDYDEAADRWVMGVQGGTSSASSYFCVAVSKTADPTGGWWTYAFKTNNVAAGTWADFPHMAIGSDAVYFGANMFSDALAFQQARAFAINKANLYAGAAAATAEAQLAGVFAPQPARINGTPTPATMHFVTRSGSNMQLWRWTNPFSSAPATYGGVLTTAGGGSVPPDATQSGSGGVIDTGDNRFLDAEWRSDRLWTTRTTACGALSCIEWVEINVSGASPATVQQGTYTSDTFHRYFPDLSIDKAGNMAIGYSRSSAGEFVGTRVTGRESTDTAGTLQADLLTKAGEVTYVDFDAAPRRWGDYSGMTVDPDGCRFWFLGEYAKNTGAADTKWGTWVSSHKFASCNTYSTITLDKSIYPCGGMMRVTITEATPELEAWFDSNVTVTSSAGDSITGANINWLQGDPGCVAGDVCGVWYADIPLVSSGNTATNLLVANGGTATVTYTDNVHPSHATQTRTVSISCQPDVLDGGYIVDGGCDETLVGETYTPYMDNGELISYTVGIYNNAYTDLTDVSVALTKSGAGAGNLTVLGPTTIAIGRIPARSVAGAVYSFSIAGAAAMAPVTLDFAVTSTADGFTTSRTISQPHFLEADDVITQQTACFIHNSADMNPRVYGTSPALPWTPLAGGSACGGETRTDGVCGNATAAAYKTAGCNTSFTANGDEVLFSPPVGPANRGNFSAGVPWRWAWKSHSTYGSSQSPGNTSGVVGIFYNDEYNSATGPTNGTAIDLFPYSLAYYYQTLWDGAASWDWEAANTGTPDSLTVAPPNQFVVNLGGIDGLSTASTWWLFAHEHMDLDLLTGGTTANNRGIAVDNDTLIWDEFHTIADATTCAAQCGTIGFDKYQYGGYPSETVTVTVLDPNAGAGPLVVTVVSGVGDSENVTLTKVGAEPRYVGTIPMWHNQGNVTNDGKLFVNPSDTLTATYADANDGTGSPCTANGYASVESPSGNVVYVSNSVIAATSTGDDDAYPDTNEKLELQITIQNNLVSSLTNTNVRISTSSPYIDCIEDDTASYGTVAAGASATNAVGDPFRFHVSSAVACTDFQNPPKATFTVYIWGDGFAGPSSLQQFTFDLDLNALVGGPAYTYTQNFTTDPNWTVAVGPGDDDNACPGQAYVNDFKYTATNGAAGGGYTAWTGDVAFNTTGRYRTFSDSVLYSPVFQTTGNPTLAFSRAFGTESGYDGAAVQSRVNSGAWTYMNFTSTTPAMGTVTTATQYCSPLAAGARAWTGAADTWEATAATAVTASAGATFQFRWRMGADSSVVGAGFGVDSVTITNVQQTVTCDNTNNGALPACVNPCTTTVTIAAGGPITFCQGGSVTLTATPAGGTAPYTYLWSNGATTASINVTATGTYTCKVKGNNGAGCESSASNPITVTVNPLPAPVITGPTATCVGVGVTLDAGAGYSSYLWSPGGATTQTVNVSPASTTTYSVTVTDSNGCSNSDTHQVTVNTAPIVAYSSNTSTTEICGNGNAVIEPGEQWSVTVLLANTGCGTASGTAATLAVNGASPVQGTITGNPGSFGNIVSGGTGSATFTFLVDSGATCVNDMRFDVTGITTTNAPNTYPNNTNAFLKQVGNVVSGASENATQVTTPLDAINTSATSNLSPAFTLATSNSATLAYTLTHQGPAGSPTDLVIQPSVADAYVWQTNASNNYGSATTMFVGKSGTGNSRRHSLIRFDISGIPAGATINSATLELNATAAGVSNVTANVYRITATWDEATVTYQTKPAISTAIGTIPFATGTGWKVSTGVASTVQGWLDGVNVNYGFYVSEDTNNSNWAFATRENATTTIRPVLRINYTPSVGAPDVINATQVELLRPCGAAQILKAYGAADAAPYNVQPYYCGAGTYQVRVSENLGGRARITGGSMTVTRNAVTQCAAATCGAAVRPVPNGDEVAGIPLGGFKSGANTAVTWDVSTCTSGDYNIYWGNMGSFGAFTGGACAIGTTGSWSGSVPDDRFFVVAGVAGSDVSSFGRDSSGAEEVFTGWAGVCPAQSTQNTTGTCP